MSKVQSFSREKNFEDFFLKVNRLEQDLNTGKMWLNVNCESQKKDFIVVRWLKCILSKFLPINLFSSIKASRVALSYLNYVEKNKDYLRDSMTLKTVQNILVLLNEKTKEKYSRKIQAYLIAMKGLTQTNIVINKSEKNSSPSQAIMTQSLKPEAEEIPLVTEEMQPSKTNNSDVAAQTQEPREPIDNLTGENPSKELATPPSLHNNSSSDTSLTSPSEPDAIQTVDQTRNESLQEKFSQNTRIYQTYTCGDGSILEGEFEMEGEYTNGCGKGTRKLANQYEMEGEFRRFVLHGKGKKWENKIGVYEGDFEFGKLKKGKFTDHSGKTFEGEFDQYLYLHGKGVITYPDGKVEDGYFEYGTLAYVRV